MVNTAWDLGIDDSMTIWFYQHIGTNINCIDYFEHSGEGIDYYIDHLKSKDYDYGMHFAPHDIMKRTLSGLTELDMARAKGINFTKIDRTPDIIQGINNVRRMFYRLWIDEEKCSKGISALDSYRKAWNEKQGCFSTHPEHNWASHGADAMRTLSEAVILYPSGATIGVMTPEKARELRRKYGPPGVQ
jgi:hypothetical protein